MSFVFIQSVKGGGTCEQWSEIYQKDAQELYPEEQNVVPKEMPWSVDDSNYEIRDDLFTTPFGHPSYVVLDENLKVRHKFIGPCCGYEQYYDCTADIAKELDVKLSDMLNNMIDEADFQTGTPSPTASQPTDAPTNPPSQGCDNDQLKSWSEWSPCSTRCSSSTPGMQFRYTEDNKDCETF